MTQVILVGPSTVPPAPGQGIPLAPGVVLGVSGVSAPDPADPTAKKTWEAHTLRPLVEHVFKTDPRFVGLSRFIVNVRIFWSFEINTACAGHGFIFFNPDFWDKIPEETRKTVMAHEVWHLIFRHLERGEGCDPVIHNEACDHVINLLLEKDGFTFEGTKPLKDPVHWGKSSDQIYNELWANRKKNPPKPQEGMASKDQIEQLIKDALAADAANGGPNKTLNQQKKEADAHVEEAQKSCGSVAGNTQIKLEASNKRIVIEEASYEKIFDKYLIDPLSGGKRTFMRPSRRSHGSPTQLITPGRFPKRGHKNRLTHLVYALDVSGSITKQQAQQFHDSVRTIKELLNPEKLTVLLFDTRIVFEKTFTEREKYGNIKVSAGGGTDLKDVYNRMRQLEAEAMVCFTDLCVAIPPQPEWESIWIVPHMNCPVPPNLYGKVYLMPNIK